MATIKVDVIGNADSLKRALSEAGIASDKAGGQFTSLAKHMAVLAGGFIGVTGLVVGFEKTVKAAEALNVATRQLDAQLRTNGESVKAIAPFVTELNSRFEKLGFTNADTEAAFTRLDRASGSAAVAYKYMGLAADLAASKHISFQQAALLVGKVIDGNVSALNRYGIAVPKGTSAVEALAIAHQKLAGQAAAAVTPMSQFSATLTDMEAKIGNQLLPVINKYLESVDRWLSKSGNQKKITDDVARAVSDFQKAVAIVVPIVKELADTAEKVAGKLGGWKQTLEILLGLKVATTLGGWVGGFAATGNSAAIASGKVGILKGQLLTLGAMADIAVTIWVLTKLKSDLHTGKTPGFLETFLMAGPAAAVEAYNLIVNTKVKTAQAAKDLEAFKAQFSSLEMNLKIDPVTGRPTSGSPFAIGGALGSALNKSSAIAVAGSGSSGKAKMLALAKAAIGTPYLWGGAGPGGFDCSGLVQWAFANGLNVAIPHSTYAQATMGKPVLPNNASVGNVVFTNYGEGGKSGPGHEGLIVGFGPNGQPIIEAAPHTGAKVQTYQGYQAFTGGGQFQVRDLTGKTGLVPGSTSLPDMTAAARARAAAAAAKAAAAAAKKPFALPTDLLNEISRFADKAKNAAGQVAVDALKSEASDLVSAIAKLKGVKNPNAATQKELTAFENKLADVQTQIAKAKQAIADDKFIKGLPEKLSGFTKKINADSSRYSQDMLKAQYDTGAALDGDFQDITTVLSDQAKTLTAERTKLQNMMAGKDKTVRAAIQAHIKTVSSELATVAAEALQNLKDIAAALQAKVTQAKTDFEGALSALTSDAMTQLQSNIYGQYGVSGDQAQLDAMQQADQMASLNDTLAAAQKQLTADLIDGSGATQDQIDADKKAVAQAQRMIDENNLSLKITGEKIQADAAYLTQSQALTVALAGWQAGVENGTASVGDLNTILTRFGLNVSGVSGPLAADFSNVSSAASALAQQMVALAQAISKITGAPVAPGAGTGGGDGGASGSYTYPGGPGGVTEPGGSNIHTPGIQMMGGGIIPLHAFAGMIVPGLPHAFDYRPVLANGGEMILNGSQQAKLWSIVGGANPAGIGARSSGGNTYNTINFPNYAGDKRELVNMLRTEMQQIQSRNR